MVQAPRTEIIAPIGSSLLWNQTSLSAALWLTVSLPVIVEGQRIEAAQGAWANACTSITLVPRTSDSRTFVTPFGGL
jgi:hypothetical protein